MLESKENLQWYNMTNGWYSGIGSILFSNESQYEMPAMRKGGMANGHGELNAAVFEGSNSQQSDSYTIR